MKSNNEIPNEVKALIAREAFDDKEALENVWRLASNPAEKLNKPALDQAVDQFAHKLSGDTPANKNPALRLLRSTWKIAASVVMLVVASYFYVTWGSIP